MPEFQSSQRVRVRKKGGDSDTQPEESVLGKEGTIWHGTGSEDSGRGAQVVNAFVNAQIATG